MKRLLLIAHGFPPHPSPGALRPGFIAHYLPRCGWTATVITATAQPPPFPVRVIPVTGKLSSFESRVRERVVARAQDPHSAPRAVIRWLKESLYFPDRTAPWMAPAIAAASEVLRTEPYDAILGTAMPASVHVISWILARRFGLPWVADYRDPWTGNAYSPRGPIRKGLEALLERGMLRRADAITTTLPAFAEKIGRANRRSDVHVIPNAYDPSDWDGIPLAAPARFDLCFTGTMYDGKRSPDLLFAALSQLRAQGDAAGNAARVHFFGRNSDNVAVSAARYGISLIVRQCGLVPRAQAMRAQRESAALLLFQNMDPSTSGEMGSKYLEYLGARRPIIAFGPPDSVLKPFILDHRLGWFASDLAETKEALRAAYARFTQGAWELKVDARDVPTAQQLAASFAQILDSVSDSAFRQAGRRRKAL